MSQQKLCGQPFIGLVQNEIKREWLEIDLQCEKTSAPNNRSLMGYYCWKLFITYWLNIQHFSSASQHLLRNIVIDYCYNMCDSVTHTRKRKTTKRCWHWFFFLPLPCMWFIAQKYGSGKTDYIYVDRQTCYKVSSMHHLLQLMQWNRTNNLVAVCLDQYEGPHPILFKLNIKDKNRKRYII